MSGPRLLMSKAQRSKDVRIDLRVTTAEKKRIQVVAQSQGFGNVCDYLRYIIRKEADQSILNALVVFHKSLNELRDRLDRLENLTDSLAGELAAQRKAASGYQGAIDRLEERMDTVWDQIAEVVSPNQNEIGERLDKVEIGLEGTREDCGL